MKNLWSKVTWLFLGLAPLLLIACGSNGAASTAPAPVTDEPMPATAVPVLEEPTMAAEAVDEDEMEGETAVSDEVMPVSAKPQLIEFYADW